MLALECSLAFPALAGSVWASYGVAFGLTAVTLGVGTGIAGYRSARQGKGFWNGFAEHVHNNWAQEVAITSAIFIVSLGITTAKFSIENAVSKKALEKSSNFCQRCKSRMAKTKSYKKRIKKSSNGSGWI